MLNALFPIDFEQIGTTVDGDKLSVFLHIEHFPIKGVLIEWKSKIIIFATQHLAVYFH